MSLLSTFALMFETDAKQAADDVNKLDDSLGNVDNSAVGAAGSFDELDGAVDGSGQGFMSLGGSLGVAAAGLITADNSAVGAAGSFDELGGAVDGSGQDFMSLGGSLGVAAAGLITVTGLIAGLVSSAAQTDEMGKFAETTGHSIEELGAWGEAVKRNGGSVESFRGSLSSLTDQLTDIELTGGGAASEVFARLGVDAIDAGGKIKDSFVILPELADAFQNLSKSESVAFGQKLGLDQGTILLLQQGRVAVEELVTKQKALGVATKEDYQAAALFNDTLDDSKQIFTNMFTTGNTTVLPLLTTMLEGFNNIVMWMGENKDLVTSFFVAAGSAITIFYLPAIYKAAAATLVVIAPFLAVGAAIAAVGVAFALLYEDVVAYLGGQESFIGDLAKKYGWFGKLVNGIIDGVKFAFKELSEFGTEMFNNLATAADFLSAAFSYVFGDIEADFSGLGVTMSDVVDIMLKAFSMLGDGIALTLDFIASPIETTKKLMQDLLDFMPDVGAAASEAFDGLKSFVGFGDDEVNANLEKAVNISSSINNNPLNGQTSASIVNSQQSISRTNNVNVGGTTINTQATDAKEVAAVVGENFNNQVSSAAANFQDAEAY